MKTTIIAEVGLAHEGSFALAKGYVQACIAAGADIVKFQFHMPHEGTVNEPFRSTVTGDTNRPAYWQRTAFTHDQWRALRGLCEGQGVGFMASTFSEDSVRWGRVYGQRQWKVPSGQVVNIPMLAAIAENPEPVYISTGLATERELEEAVDVFIDSPVTLMHTVTEYPTAPESWRLGQIERLARRFLLPVGLSDHSGTITCGLAAAARFPSLAAIEVHVTLSKRMVTPDTPASLTIEDLERLVQGVRQIEESRSLASWPPAGWEQARMTYMPTLVAKGEIQKGTKVQLNHLIYRKMGCGPGLDWKRVVGRVAARDIAEGEGFAEADFEVPCAQSVS